MTNLEFHPLANLFPLIEGAEFEQLVADIKANGVREPVITYEGKILDGRNRFKAANAAGAEVPFREYEGADPLGFVISLNLHRRHLNESQRAMVAAAIATLGQGKPANLPVKPVTQAEAAERMQVSERSVRAAAKVRDEGAPELADAVRSGAVSVSAAADVAELPKAEQAEIVAKGEREILEAAKRIRQEKAEARREENAAKLAAAPPPPDGKYRVIVIDPPWDMKRIDCDVRIDQHGAGFDYPTMTHAEIGALPVEAMADDSCHLFCWTTQKHLPPTLQIIEQWGFKYVLLMVWHKAGGFQPFGLPQYNCEFVVYARRGSPQFVDTKAFNCCFEAPRREHSRKPDEFYDVIRRVTAGPRIDVFSREERDGFDTWGNEAGKFAA